MSNSSDYVDSDEKIVAFKGSLDSINKDNFEKFLNHRYTLHFLEIKKEVWTKIKGFELSTKHLMKIIFRHYQKDKNSTFCVEPSNDETSIDALKVLKQKTEQFSILNSFDLILLLKVPEYQNEVLQIVKSRVLPDKMLALIAEYCVEERGSIWAFEELKKRKKVKLLSKKSFETLKLLAEK